MSEVLTKIAWIKCSVERGMLPGEYAVEIETANAGKVSLFAQADKVNIEQGLLCVELLEADLGEGEGLLVRLPGYPFECASRNVRVVEVLSKVDDRDEPELPDGWGLVKAMCADGQH